MENRETRLALIEKIERKRNTRLISYVVGDRKGLEAPIQETDVRPLYDHLLALPKKRKHKIDLFLYSRGGAVEIPWKIVCMIREFASEFSVLIPYRAHSAATMIALGADNILMGKKGELGPIDPIMTKTPSEPGKLSQRIAIEDVLSYVDFLRKRANISDQEALSKTIVELPKKIEPWVIGAAYRVHEHINLVAKKLLEQVGKKGLRESEMDAIIETLVEKTYLHGHGIGRSEAKTMKLPLINPSAGLEELMWKLYKNYEKSLKLLEPIDFDEIIPEHQEEYAEEEIALAYIESVEKLHVLEGTLKIKHIRQMPQQLNININIQLPHGTQIQPQTQQQLQNLLSRLQGSINQQIQRQVRQQAPIAKTERKLINILWKEKDISQSTPS